MKTRDEIKERFNDILNLRFNEFECGEGWNDLIWDTLEKLEVDLKESDSQIMIIKEKFGELRIQGYINGTEKIYGIIQDAEIKSQTICEECGSKKGKNKNRSGWYKTMCPTCEKELS
jgi:hypothetical protein